LENSFFLILQHPLRNRGNISRRLPALPRRARRTALDTTRSTLPPGGAGTTATRIGRLKPDPLKGRDGPGVSRVCAHQYLQPEPDIFDTPGHRPLHVDKLYR
jgi:hypothetical protein